MNCYETLFILKPTLTEEETAKQIDAVKASITDQDGEIVATNDMGVRKLAYEINKNERGYYTVIYHKSPASSITEIERKLRYNEDALKFFTIKYGTKREVAEFDRQVANCSAKKEESKEETSSEA